MKLYLSLMILMVIGLSACQASPEAIATQTAAAGTTIAEAWTKTPTLAPTFTFTPTLTFTPTQTFTPSPTKTLTPTVTFTPKPTLTITPCQPIAGVISSKDILVPTVAMLQDDNLAYFLGGMKAEAIRKGIYKTDYSYLIVLFEGMQVKKNYVGMQDLAWQRQMNNCLGDPSIGLGFPVKDVGNPVIMLGRLTKGKLMVSGGGEKPLLALIYVVPKETLQVTLFSPAGVKHEIPLTNGWTPDTENYVTDFAYDNQGYIEQSLETDQYCASNFAGCVP